MASGTVSCWRCGVQWAQEDQPPTRLRLIAGGAQDHSRSDVERWANEGGSFGSDVAVARRAAVRR
jgi:hypothetical protein